MPDSVEAALASLATMAVAVRRADDGESKKQPLFCAPDREEVHQQTGRRIDWFDMLLSGKQPTHEVHGSNSHAHAEQNSCQHALRFAFAESEHEASDDNGDETQAPRDRACKGSLQDIHRVLPRRVRKERR
jgi:hypothetical protein